MDRKKIDLSLISPGPQAFFYGLKDEDAAKTARIVNEGIAQMVAKRPDRLRGMATLPMQHPDAAIAELGRVVKDYEFNAVEIGTAIGDEEHPVDRLEATPRLTPAEREAIGGENAARLFGLKA